MFTVEMVVPPGWARKDILLRHQCFLQSHTGQSRIGQCHIGREGLFVS